MRYSPDYETPQTDAYGLPIQAGRERLSSLMTPFQKFVFPAIWPVLMVFFWYQVSRTGGLDLGSPLLLFGIFGVAGTAFIFWYAARLCKVEREGPDLILSNYHQEIRVPLAEVAEVKCARWSKAKEITLLFRRQTELGSRVTFVPKTEWFLMGWGEHPLAEELRSLVREHRYYAQGQRWVDRPERKTYMPSWTNPDPAERGKNIPEWPDEERPKTGGDHRF